jgi:hypothetical protein
VEAGFDDGYRADQEACGEEFRGRENCRNWKECREECWEELQQQKCGGGEDSCWDCDFGFA